MKKILAAGIAAAAFCSAPALAADIPTKGPIYKAPAPVFSWTGCYLGGNLGYGRDRTRFDDIVDPDTTFVTSHKFVGGGQIGCDYQANNWVVGLQGMFDGTDLGGHAFPEAGAGNPSLFTTSKVSWFSTATGRIGYAVNPNTLVYAKGGAAWIHNKYTQSTGALLEFVLQPTRIGWVAGGGVEWAFAPHWSLFLEYDYLNFGSHLFQFTDLRVGGTTFPIVLKQNTQAVLVGINYRFGGDPWGKSPVVAKY